MDVNSEDMVQVLNQTKSDVFRDFRVCTPCRVSEVHFPMVDVAPLVADVSNDVVVNPPLIKNLRVVGFSSLTSNGMPKQGDLGVILHLDRKNSIDGSLQVSNGPAHDISFGVFLPIVMADGENQSI